MLLLELDQSLAFGSVSRGNGMDILLGISIGLVLGSVIDSLVGAYIKTYKGGK